ncbi:hypothetical protein PDM90_02615 [Bacillus cereus]|nr:hypothetical protein [Bacillus cereus]
MNSNIAMKVLSAKMSDEPPLLYPDGKQWVEVGFKVFNEDTGEPVPNAKVIFSVQPLRPNDPSTRTEQGVVEQYPKETREKIRTKIQNGEIKLIGILDKSETTSDPTGIAKVKYTSSHIGGNQPEIGQEKIVATIVDNGKISEFIVNLGYDFLVEIPTVDKLVRIVNAKGVYIHKELAPLFGILAKEIQELKWNVPMTISAGALKWGGLYPPHSAHRFGAEFDIWTMATDDLEPYKYTHPKYDREKTQILVNSLIKHGARKIYFQDPNVTGVTSYAGHDDHLHVSFAPDALKNLFHTKVNE